MKAGRAAARLLTLSAYARHRGVSLPAVRKAVKTGRIPTIDGKVNPGAADRAWAANTDLSTPSNSVNGNPRGAVRRAGAGRARGAAPSGLAHEQARRMKAAAAREELKLQLELKELLPRAAVEKAAFEMHRRARDRLRLIETRLGPLMTPEVLAMLRKEIRDVCHELGPERH